MSELLDLVVLARVVERGSFAKAAADFGVPPSTLSRKVAALEKRLGVRVLERTTRSLRTTEIGELLAVRGARIRSELDDAERVVVDHQRAPKGLLRLTIPTPVADDFIGPAIAEYLRRYPEMRIEVVAEDFRYSDLVTEGFDVAVRVGPIPDSTLRALKLAVVAPVLAGTQRYLDRSPPLRHPRELAEHAIVAFGKRRKATWSFAGRGGSRVDVEVAPRAVANSAKLVAELAAAGVGLALLPRFVATAAGLAILEPGGFHPATTDLSVITPSARSEAAKVRAFIDVLREQIAARPEMFDPVEARPPRASR